MAGIWAASVAALLLAALLLRWLLRVTASGVPA
jgi:hypothetical protein